MNRTKKLVAVLLLMSQLCTNAFAQTDISAKSAIVMDAYSNRILYEKDAYSLRPMASTTKIMTALIALERLSLDEVVTVSPFASSTEGSSVWLSPGEHMTVEDLLYALMLSSGNDAAVALAEHTAGNVGAFSVLMNERAREIGALHTNFTNPHGLPDDNHYTSAYDLALISSKAIKNPKFKAICSTKTKTVSWEGSQWKRKLSNHNKLLKNYEYAVGIKTGYTKKAGRCLVSAAEKDGQLLVAVTLSDPDDWNDHVNLLNECFDRYFSFTVFKKDDIAEKFVIDEEKNSYVNLLYGDTFKLSLTEEEKDMIRIENRINATLPIEKGQSVGVCSVYLSDKCLGSVDLVASESVKARNDFVSVFIKLLKGLMR